MKRSFLGCGLAAAFSLGAQSTAAAQTVVSFDAAVELVLEAALGWPDDYGTLKEIIARNTTAKWMAPWPPVDVPARKTDDPWFGSFSETLGERGLSRAISCLRLGAPTLAMLRKTVDAKAKGKEGPFLPEWTSAEAELAGSILEGGVPPEAMVAQGCQISLWVDAGAEPGKAHALLKRFSSITDLGNRTVRAAGWSAGGKTVVASLLVRLLKNGSWPNEKAAFYFVSWRPR